MISFRKKTLCLDWDKRYVRVLVARIGKGIFRIDDAHAHRIPAEVDSEDPAVLGAFIAQVLAQHRIKLRHVTVDVPRDKAVIARLPLPPTPVEELPAVVRFQAMKELPFPIEETALDYVSLQRDDSGKNVTEVLLAAVRSDVLARVRATCDAAGLTPVRIGLRPYANLVSVIHLPDMADKRVLFVDVGPAMTEINVVRAGALAFTRAANVSVPVQGEDEKSWESSRIAVVGADGGSRAVNDAIADLVVEVVRSLQAYRATESNAVIDSVVVAGATGVETELAQALEKRLALPTELFDPTLSLGVSGARGAELRAFSAVLGLAWGLSREGLLELDFLNPKKVVKRSEAVVRRLRIVGIAAALVLAIVAGKMVLVYRAEAATLEDTRKQISDTRAEVKKARELANKVAEWDEWTTEGVWLDHLRNIAEDLHDALGKHVIAKSIQMEEGSATIRIDLIASNLETANKFIELLNNQTIDDKRVYLAQAGTWAEGNTSEPGFTGGMQVTAKVIDLAIHNDPAKAAERRKEREDAVKKI